MDRKAKVEFSTTYVMTALILIFDIVVLLLASAGSLKENSSLYPLAALASAMGVIYDYLSFKKMLRWHAEEIAAEAAEESEETAEDEADQEEE